MITAGHLSVSVIVTGSYIKIMAKFLIFKFAVSRGFASPFRSIGYFLKFGTLVVYKILHPIADLCCVVGIVHIAKTDKDGVVVSACAERIVSCSDSKCNIIDRSNFVGTWCTFGNVDAKIPLAVYFGMILRRLTFCIADNCKLSARTTA